MADLWRQLHTHALANKGEDESKFLLNFSIKIPRYTTGCKCREHWSKWFRSNPPKYGPNGEFFAWSVFAHNSVSEKLGKKTLTVEEARKLYQ